MPPPTIEKREGCGPLALSWGFFDRLRRDEGIPPYGERTEEIRPILAGTDFVNSTVLPFGKKHSIPAP